MHYTQSDKHCGEDLDKKIINATSQIRKKEREKKRCAFIPSPQPATNYLTIVP